MIGKEACTCLMLSQDGWEVLVDEVDLKASTKQYELQRHQESAQNAEREAKQSKVAEALHAEVTRTMRTLAV